MLPNHVFFKHVCQIACQTAGFSTFLETCSESNRYIQKFLTCIHCMARWNNIYIYINTYMKAPVYVLTCIHIHKNINVRLHTSKPICGIQRDCFALGLRGIQTRGPDHGLEGLSDAGFACERRRETLMRQLCAGPKHATLARLRLNSSAPSYAPSYAPSSIISCRTPTCRHVRIRRPTCRHADMCACGALQPRKWTPRLTEARAVSLSTLSSCSDVAAKS